MGRPIFILGAVLVIQLLNDLDPALWKLGSFVFGCYFLWSMRATLNGFKEEVKDLKRTIEKLFARDDEFEKRISQIEGRCEANHGRRENNQ